MNADPRDVVESEDGITTSELPSVSDRAKELGLTVPDGDICALPRKFFVASDVSELTYEPNTTDVKVLLRHIGVTLNTVQGDGVKIPFRQDRDDTWVTPVLTFTAGLIARNPKFVKAMIEAIGSYTMELFRGAVGRVRFTCAVEKTEDKKTILVAYNGPADKLGDVIKHIEKLAK